MAKKAIVYVSDVILGQTGEVISCEEQLARVTAHAQEHGIEVVATYRDEVYAEDPSERPGLKAMCVCKSDADTVLVDRVWAISRDWRVVRPLLQGMKDCGVKLECATVMWDCVSQMSRNFFRAKPVELRPALCALAASEPAHAAARPAELHFAGLRRRATA
jgi:DNA invertase Pin-like site-specific DNA recombinase